MTVFMIYLIKVTLIHGALFLFYWLFLKRTGRHQFNRIFLLMGLILAFFIPLMELPATHSIPLINENEEITIWLTKPIIDYEVILSPIEKEAKGLSFWILLPISYILVTFFFFTRSIISMTSIGKLRKQSESVKKYWFKLYKTSHSQPFSFFSNVFIPRTLFGSKEFDQVLAHECVHVKQRHSMDRLLLDFAVSLFWFNPFIYLYRNALIEIHEYQADETVVKRFKDPIRYQEILFSMLQTPQYSGMVSHFNVSIIKKRIVMMNKQNKQSKWIYLIVAPLTLVMIFAFSSKDTMKPIEKMGGELAEKLDRNLVFNLSELNFQNDYVPSILPIKNAEETRMSSGFGKRVHPIYKVEKMHNGVDFTCEMGTEIIATADGVVELVQVSSTGYGKKITLNHGDKYKTQYGQLSEFKVEEGAFVKKGEVIALSGNSGSSTGPHLHYEVIEVGVGQVDPKPFIKNYEFKVEEKKKNDVREKVKQKESKTENEKQKGGKEKSKAKSVKIKSSGELANNQIESDNKDESQKAIEKLEMTNDEAISEVELPSESKKLGLKEKNKEKTKSIDKLKNEKKDPRMSKVEEFLERYEGSDLDLEDWAIVFKEDKVKIKRRGSLESIVLYDKKL